MHDLIAVRASLSRRRRSLPRLLALASMVFAMVATCLGVATPSAQAYSGWSRWTTHACQLDGSGSARDCVFTAATDRDTTGLVMDVLGGSSSTGEWLNAYPLHDGSNQAFSLHPKGDGSFQIKTGNQLCLMPGWWSAGWRLRPVEQQRCDGSEKWQYWYFVPGPDKEGTATFTIRNAADDQCIDVAWRALTARWLNMWPCHGEDNQLWGGDFGGGADFTKEWAAKYALTKCDASVAAHSSTPYCSYSQSQVAVTGNDAGVAQCLVAQHTTDAIPSTTVDYKVTTSNSTITSDSIANGTKETVTVKLGSSSDFFHIDLAAEVSQLITHSVQTSTTNTEEKTYRAVVPAAPAHSTTWVKAFPVSKTYTGKFVFSKGSWDEWTWASDTKITVTYPAGSGGTMMYDSGVTPDTLDPVTGRWQAQPACISDGPTERMTQ